MAELQYLFSEIEISRAAFDRWLKSDYIASVDLAKEHQSEPSIPLTVTQTILPFLNAPADELRILLLHDKRKSICHFRLTGRLYRRTAFVITGISRKNQRCWVE